MGSWTLHVKDFGKIKEANVAVAPLTFFVGDNNSGKSYLMTLIYGLLHVEFFFQGYQFDETSAAYQRCSRVTHAIMEDAEIEEAGYHTLEPDEICSFESLLNEVLQLNRDKFLQDLFNHKMQIGDISITFSRQIDYELEYRLTYEEQEMQIMLCGMDRNENALSGYIGTVAVNEKTSTTRFFISYILQYMLRYRFEKKGFTETAYLPITRTGFLLTYKMLAEDAMRDKFNITNTRKNLLTKPNSDFLRTLSRMSSMENGNAFVDLAAFIEHQMIHGHITMPDMPTQDIQYTPESGDRPLPLHVTSGVVTEVTPLLLFLQHINLGTLLIEEPEISLHPQLQWVMARTLIRLMNAGVSVIATTHSDLILQHVNNMLKLAKRADRLTCAKRLGYQETDLLHKEAVAVYQFDVQPDNKTMVTELSCGDYGFEAMTFYHTLKAMNEQINTIEGDLDAES